jgi:hypothetical protein
MPIKPAPDYRSAILGLVNSNISVDKSGFVTLTGINPRNFTRACEAIKELLQPIDWDKFLADLKEKNQ